jgi:hypothetical protein
MYWISDEQHDRALATVTHGGLSVRDQLARARMAAERRRRIAVSGMALLAALVAAVFG